MKMMTFTQKETLLLKDLISQEELCVEKYTNHAEAACDPGLSTMFKDIGMTEEQHLDTLTQLSGGTVPAMGSGGKKPMVPQQPFYTGQKQAEDKQVDKFLCADILATEKHASGLYDMSIFEFRDVGVRNVLNHIQKEEQEHGEKVYAYMEKNGMYS